MTPFIIWKSLITDSRLRVCQSIRSVIYCSSIDPGGDVNLPFLQCLSLFMFSVAEILMKKQGRQKRNIARQVAIFGCQRLGLHKQKYIAEYFSLSHQCLSIFMFISNNYSYVETSSNSTTKSLDIWSGVIIEKSSELLCKP